VADGIAPEVVDLRLSSLSECVQESTPIFYTELTKTIDASLSLFQNRPLALWERGKG
jgi:hypothetical protein